MENFTTHLKSNWIIYAFLVQLIINWTITGTRLDLLETRVSKIESELTSNELLLIEIQKDIVEVKTSLEFIKQRLQ